MKSLLLLKKIAPIFVTVLVAAFVLGYYFIGDNDHDMLQRPEDIEMVEKDAEQPSDDTIMDNISGPRTTPGTRLILKTYYIRCGHTVVDRQDIHIPLVGLGEEGLLAHYPGWDVEKFQQEEVILLRKVEGACPGHYVLRAVNGYVAIYKTAENGEEVLTEVTDIPLSILRLRDQDRLRQGMLLDSMEEVNHYLEDLGS
ncbi:MAG: hypothetical protein ACOX42_05530 [Clostridia bacterium]